MELKSLLDLINVSDYISQERKDFLNRELFNAFPYKKVERKNAMEALDIYETISYAHKLFQKNLLAEWKILFIQ